MAFNVRHPLWLPAAPAPGIRSFAILYLIETFTRASVATVIPIQAFDLLKNEQTVSFVYTAIGLVALGFSLIIPAIIRSASRRWTYTFGAFCFVLTAVCLATYSVAGQASGMILRVVGTACLNVTLNLYILDFIRKQDYVRNDSTRLALSTVGWTVAPFAGVWLYTNHGPGAVYALSAGFALILIAVFWYFRLSDNPVIRPGRIRPARPLGNVGRFIAQPRLRLAWAIAFGRSSYWSTFFVYAPLLMVVSGESKEMGGLIVSLGNAMLITLLFWGPMGERFGVRRLATLGFIAAGLFLLAAGYFGTTQPLVTAGFILAAALFVVPLDAVGTVPFYRSVHPHERAEMTSVYRTYLDVGELLPPLVYGVLLGVFGMGAVFVALAALLFVCATLSFVFLPRRL